MINDTMIRYSPETGYPVTKVGRRRRVVASPDGGLPHDATARRALRWLLNAVAALFGVAAIAWVVLGAAGHVNSWVSAGKADAAISELDQQWSAGNAGSAAVAAGSTAELLPATASDFAPATEPVAGVVWGKLHVPTLGLTNAPIYQGTTSEQINVGIGHYTQTRFPWQEGGNMGLAGHRTGWEELFNRLDELHPGDKVFVETKDAYFEYKITGSKVIAPTDTWVLDSNPAMTTGASGDSQLLTLTTCDGPDNEMRLAVWGQLTSVYDKSAGAVQQALS